MTLSAIALVVTRVSLDPKHVLLLLHNTGSNTTWRDLRICVPVTLRTGAHWRTSRWERVCFPTGLLKFCQGVNNPTNEADKDG